MQGKYRIDLNVHGESVPILVVTSYQKGNRAVLLQMPDGSPWCHLSVNLEDQNHILDDDEFFAKDYGEGKETFHALLNAGYIERCGGRGIAGMHGPLQSVGLPKRLSFLRYPNWPMVSVVN
jgi:hypothetical protein